MVEPIVQIAHLVSRIDACDREIRSLNFFATSIPTNLCSMTRPCECGLTVRTERLFGLTGNDGRGARLIYGLKDQDRNGLPLATAAGVITLPAR
jgi:hypothetical protein